jgi:hypothetical protein
MGDPNFCFALVMLKAGRRVRRAGWNGKGMWLGLVTGDSWEIRKGSIPLGVFHAIARDTDKFAPWIAMRTADRQLVPWLASQTDILAEDWELVD